MAAMLGDRGVPRLSSQHCGLSPRQHDLCPVHSCSCHLVTYFSSLVLLSPTICLVEVVMGEYMSSNSHEQ